MEGEKQFQATSRQLPGIARLGIGLGAALVVSLVGLAIYASPTGLKLRAELGQTSGRYLLAVEQYSQGDLGPAITTIKPLVTEGHLPSLNLVCGFLNGREPVAPTPEGCVTKLENQPELRLASLTDLAIWAQEWDVAASLVQQRASEGDITAHFDKARLVRAAPSGRFTGQDLLDALQQSAEKQDPRGQYAAVVLALDVGANGALSPVLAELLDRRPKLSAADAYFELAKLMQTGAISSDLDYVEVLRRADAGGNVHAARYLAQYYSANPQLDAAGAERDKWMRKAANSDDPVAQYNLAVEMLAAPPEVRQMEEAVALLDRSASSGFAPALNLLGATLWQMPRLGTGEPEAVQDQAMKLMQAAAERNDANAHYNLGKIYLSRQDTEQALPYLRRASELGNTPARELLVQLGDSGK